MATASKSFFDRALDVIAKALGVGGGASVAPVLPESGTRKSTGEPEDKELEELNKRLQEAVENARLANRASNKYSSEAYSIENLQGRQASLETKIASMGHENPGSDELLDKRLQLANINAKLTESIDEKESNELYKALLAQTPKVVGAGAHAHAQSKTNDGKGTVVDDNSPGNVNSGHTMTKPGH